MSNVKQQQQQGARGGSLAVRDDFAGRSMTAASEMGTSALIAEAQAEVQAAYIMAMKRPRDWNAAREKLLEECARPGFAAVARYHKPIGQGIEGPSIRFAEAAIRYATNIRTTQTTIFDDAIKRQVRVTVTDLESNGSYSKEIVLEKCVERSRLKDGQVAISVRTNTAGKPVYLVASSEDELLMKESNLVSKAIRTLALRLIPGDIVDDCMDAVTQTLQRSSATDPDRQIRDMVAAFARGGVTEKDLVEYLGHPIAKTTQEEHTEMRALFAALKNGDAEWADALDRKKASRGPGGAGGHDPQTGEVRS